MVKTASGAALAAVIALGGTGAATSQGMMLDAPSKGYAGGKGYAGKQHYFKSEGAGPRHYRAARPAGRYYRPAAPYRGKHRYRAHGPRYGYRAAAPGHPTCGEFKFWSVSKGRCIDARTSPPDLKPGT